MAVNLRSEQNQYIHDMSDNAVMGTLGCDSCRHISEMYTLDTS